MTEEKNNSIYKGIIAVLVIIILILGFLLINNKKNNNSLNINTNVELESENKTLKEDKEDLLKQIDDLNDNIQSLEDNAKTLSKDDCSKDTTDLSDLQKQISTLKDQATTLKDSVSTLENDKENLNNQITTYKATIDTLNKTITELNNKIIALQSDKDTLNSTITSQKETITTLTNENKTLQETSETYTVFYVASDKTIYTEQVKKGNDVKNVPTVPENGSLHGEWSSSGKNITEDTIIYAKYYYEVTLGVSKINTVEIATLSSDIIKIYVDEGTTIKINTNAIDYNGKTVVTATLKDEYSYYFLNGWVEDLSNITYVYTNEELTITGDTNLYFYSMYACVAKGSKIAMADGTSKNVEDLTLEDTILSYDYYTGTIAPKKIVSILKGTDKARVFTVKLANGYELDIVDNEYVFDTDLKEYIPINISTYEDAIGKNIMINDNGDIAYSKIVSITLKEEEIEHYTLYAEESINYIANGIIARTPTYFLNLRYTIGSDYKIDSKEYQKDISKYGTYTYNDLKDVCTKETFDNFVLKDFKPVVEKGIISFEQFKMGIKELQEEIDYYNSK